MDKNQYEELKEATQKYRFSLLFLLGVTIAIFIDTVSNIKTDGSFFFHPLFLGLMLICTSFGYGYVSGQIEAVRTLTQGCRKKEE